METKYIVDRVVEEIVVAEEMETRQLTYFDKNILGFEVSDGDVIACKDGFFSKDDNEKNKRLEIIKEKFNRVRRPK